MGFERFTKAMTSYFNKYAFKNTVLKDLLDEMVAACDNDNSPVLDMEIFEKEWICTSGLNTVKPAWDK